MNIKILTNHDINRNMVLIQCHPKNKNLVKQICHFIKLKYGTLKVFDDEYNYYHMYIWDICYIDELKRTISVYTEKDVYYITKSLKQLMVHLSKRRFIQVSAHTIVNTLHIDHYYISADSRRIIVLDNGCEVVVNRHYKDVIDNYLFVKDEELM